MAELEDARLENLCILFMKQYENERWVPSVPLQWYEPFRTSAADPHSNWGEEFGRITDEV